MEDRLPAGHPPHRELLRQQDEVGFGESQAGHALVAAPHLGEPAKSRRRRRDISQGGEVRAFQACAGGRGQTLTKNLFDPWGLCQPLGFRRETPVRLLDVRQKPLNIELVAFRRQRASGEIEEALRRQFRIEQGVPQGHPRAAPRQSVRRAGEFG
jgi:hypothetical protein